MIKHAFKYIKQEWKVFPVKFKKPAIEGWQDEATSDPERIPSLFNVYHTGIGLPTGKESNRTVVDVDNKDGRNGFFTLEMLGIELPATVCCSTPNNGRQYHYNYCPNLKNMVDALGEKSGVDIRNDGGLAILPPSVHENGGTYEWLSDQAPGEIPIADFPDQLYKAILEHTKPKNKGFDLPDKICTGQRNDTIFKYACKLRASGLEQEEITSAAGVVNQERCEKPLADNEIKALVASACTYDKGIVHLDSEGKVKKTMLNVVGFFKSDQNLIGLFYFNLFDGCIHYSRTPVWDNEIKSGKRVGDDDIVFIKHYLAVNHRFEPSVTLIGESIIIVARENSIHPVRDYLNSLKWDGKERLKNWLTTSAGVAENAYTVCVGIKTLVGAVARVFVPGIKFDYMLILEGPQGIGKSTLVKILSGDWYTAVSLTDTDKDTIDAMLGAWVIENEEMVCFTKQEIERVKAFLSRSTDRVRLSYGRRSQDFPRQSIFMGTMNPAGDTDYLRDPTGNRRFWPVLCTKKIDQVWLRENRDQLFAEAVVRFKAGEKLWIDDPEAEEIMENEQDVRQSKDIWTEPIYAFIKDKEDEVTATEILNHCLHIEVGRMTKSDQTRVGIIMKHLGWERHYDKTVKCSVYSRKGSIGLVQVKNQRDTLSTLKHVMKGRC